MTQKTQQADTLPVHRCMNNLQISTETMYASMDVCMHGCMDAFFVNMGVSENRGP